MAKEGNFAQVRLPSGEVRKIRMKKSVFTDKIPKGKREDKSLHKKVKEIQKDLDDGNDPAGKKMTVCRLYEKHI